MSNTSAAITKANVAIKTAQRWLIFAIVQFALKLFWFRNAKKSESKISSLESEITTAQQTIEEVKHLLTELEEEARTVIEKQEEHHVSDTDY